MNGVDAIVLTAGIGENDAHVRSEVIKGMTWFGCELDEEQNAKRGEELVISTEDSKVKVLLILTDEELMIARDVECWCAVNCRRSIGTNEFHYLNKKVLSLGLTPFVLNSCTPWIPMNNA